MIEFGCAWFPARLLSLYQVMVWRQTGSSSIPAGRGAAAEWTEAAEFPFDAARSTLTIR